MADNRRRKRKQPEFRPDPARSTFLSRLHLTQKQRKTFLKWFLFAVTLVFLSVLQDTLMCRLRIFGAATDLVPCGIFLICLLQGSEAGCIFGLISSCIYYFSGSAPGTFSIIYLTFLGLFATVFRQSFLRKGFGATMLCAAAALLLYEIAVGITALVLGLLPPSRLVSYPITWGMTLAFQALLYPILLSIDKIGGDTWKE